MTSNVLPVADSAETKLRRPIKRPSTLNCMFEWLGRRAIAALTLLQCSNAHVLKIRCFGPAKTYTYCLRHDLRSWFGSARELLQHLTSSIRDQGASECSATPLLPLRFNTFPHTWLENAMAPVSFWSTPGQYIHWAARAKPAIFWSIAVGCIGPIMVVRRQTQLMDFG
jgi:hypothetical protein